jgi:hypothetical protein
MIMVMTNTEKTVKSAHIRRSRELNEKLRRGRDLEGLKQLQLEKEKNKGV